MNPVIPSAFAFGCAAVCFTLAGQQSFYDWKTRRRAKALIAAPKSFMPAVPKSTFLERWNPLKEKKKRERSQLISSEMASALQLIIGQLRVGRSVTASIAEVADAIPAPLGDILKEAVAESRIGIPIEDVLEKIAQREENRHLGVIASALVLHSRHGGSLVEILETVIESIEEEDRLQRDIRSLTADGRLSATVLLAMPPMMLILVSLLSPGYAAPLVNDPLGRVMAVSGVVLSFTGWRWLNILSHPRVVA